MKKIELLIRFLLIVLILYISKNSIVDATKEIDEITSNYNELEITTTRVILSQSAHHIEFRPNNINTPYYFEVANNAGNLIIDKFNEDDIELSNTKLEGILNTPTMNGVKIKSFDSRDKFLYHKKSSDEYIDVTKKVLVYLLDRELSDIEIKENREKKHVYIDEKLKDDIFLVTRFGSGKQLFSIESEPIVKKISPADLKKYETAFEDSKNVAKVSFEESFRDTKFFIIIFEIVTILLIILSLIYEFLEIKKIKNVEAIKDNELNENRVLFENEMRKIYKSVMCQFEFLSKQNGKQIGTLKDINDMCENIEDNLLKKFEIKNEFCYEFENTFCYEFENLFTKKSAK